MTSLDHPLLNASLPDLMALAAAWRDETRGAPVTDSCGPGATISAGPSSTRDISRAAGASHGWAMTADRFAEVAAALGRPLEQRTTGYGRVLV